MKLLRAGLLCVLLVPPVLAQERTHDITPEDYFTLNTVVELSVSPDDKQIAYCLATWDETADNRKTDLWIVAIDGKSSPLRLTFDRANDRKLRWSADAATIYFLGNRKREAEKKPPYDGTPQVWQIAAAGGEPRAVTRVPEGVHSYDLASLVDAIYFTRVTTATDNDDFSKLRAKYKADYGHGSRKVSQVHRLNLRNWRVEKIVDEKRYIHEFAVTRDGKRLAMITAPDDTVIAFEERSRVDVWEAGAVRTTDESWRKSAASSWPWLESLAWNPAGDRLAFCTIFDAHPAEVILQEWINGWTARRQRRSEKAHVRGYGSPIWWIADKEVVYLCEHSGSVGLFHAEVEAQSAATLIEPNAVIYDRMRTVRLRGSATGFAELEHVVDSSEVRPLTDLNPHTKTWKLPSVQHITWKAPDGTAVGGVLELPHGYKQGKLPLVVAIHGGPTTSTKAALEFDPHNGRLYFAAKGYAVLLPNYRGSTGYGDKFVAGLIGNENDVDVKDILAGIQHLIQQGIADPERIGVCGWSNGGYLTNCLITLRDSPIKFRAASSGASILDTVAEWGFNDEPAYPRVFKKGLPWEQPGIYLKTSPTYGLGNVTTPTLIHVGANDERCPPGHSRMLYRALKEYVNVPTELVVYPDEPHGLSKMSHRRAKMEWDLAWFEKHMKEPSR